MTEPDYTPPAWYRPASLVRRLLRRLVRPPSIAVTSHEYARMSLDGYLGSMAPLLPQAPAELRDDVDELAEARALDEGTGPVFDRTIAAWVEQWCNQVDATHDSRQSVLRWREIQAQAEAIRCAERAELARHRIQELNRELDWLNNDMTRHRARGRGRPWFPGRRTPDMPMQRPTSEQHSSPEGRNHVQPGSPEPNQRT